MVSDASSSVSPALGGFTTNILFFLLEGIGGVVEPRFPGLRFAHDQKQLRSADIRDASRCGRQLLSAS